MAEFGARTSADEVLSGLDLTGRRVIVTGANTGIGFDTARALAAAGAHVVLACRSADTGRAAADRIRARHPRADAVFEPLDLASLASVRDFVERAAPRPLDVLICNAGLVTSRYEETEEGFERTVGVCHVGHAALTLGLLPALLRDGGGRVVMVSSESHRSPRTLDFDRLPLDRPRFSTTVAYGQAKLCNVLFANELQRRYGDRGLSACSLHPGTMVTTDIGRGWLLARVAMALLSPFTKNPNQGAATSVYCATASVEEVAGRYFSDCRPKQSSPGANDLRAADELFRRSLDWTGLAADEVAAAARV